MFTEIETLLEKYDDYDFYSDDFQSEEGNLLKRMRYLKDYE